MASAMASDEDAFVLVTVEPDAEDLLNHCKHYKIVGLETPHPIMRIDGQELIGSYEEETTAMLFGDSAVPAAGEGEHTTRGAGSVDLRCTTTMWLKFRFSKTVRPVDDAAKAAAADAAGASPGSEKGAAGQM